ncbi:phospho-sugar mutase [Chlamydia abortus]|uniref:Phosphomannomutase n=1 Tax=Chlamydia abortus (strain DSM 27085 / S26/3) TaxID=218497 RepID=Q5L6E1_CHLAB|nr:phospho-sugar mutase [Chlamydia abortus]ASD30507.1 phosphoglucomutase [Chlamydia abortus]AUS59788.1 phospho-sugar mutase [Chlamydia abortus]QRR32031.1 phospho-sugar mutase [Chlamydia abortus]CAH63785.1 putative phosphomannomutase [Chlamydia abortus S26/3]CED80390.1 putative phosphomannomutase [Chlamydia abortus]
MQHLQKKIEALCSPITTKNILTWLSNDCNEQDKDTIAELLNNDPKRLEELFGMTLSFGTGGLRSPMGLGTNRINVFTIRRATQGLAQVLKKHHPHSGDLIRVVVGYDTRHNSFDFAQETAKVLAGNNIHVLLFKHPEPLALVSFTLRAERALAGVMITASHNPPEYNGYKVYMASGGQVLPPWDQEIMHASAHIEEIAMASSLQDPYIHFIGEEYEQLYVETVHTLQLYPEDNRISGPAIRVSYSPLHGTGVAMIPRVLRDWNFPMVNLVEKQAIPDGDFPTVHLPNPEDPEALTLGIEQMLRNQDDIFIATDPDADRLGVVCLHENQPYRFNGNQIACLLADHILRALSARAPLGKEDKVVKSLVTTEMLSAIVKFYGGDIVNVGTGFKYIGEKIEAWRESVVRYIFGAEESYGYLYGTHVEDKDAMSTSALITEAALHQKLQGKTLRDAILDLYETHGYFMNKTLSLSFEQGQESLMKSHIEKLAKLDPSTMSLRGYSIHTCENYDQGTGINIPCGITYKLPLPKMAMLCYYYQNGGKIIVRPSGTEPKIKLYFELVNHYEVITGNKKEQRQREEESREQLEKFIAEFKEKFFSIESEE